MKIKIKDTIYDEENEPIMIILSPADKKNINNMFPHCTKYAAFPDGTTEEEMDKFMEI